MGNDAEEIGDDEWIIRRIPPPLSEHTRERDSGGHRPISQKMQKLKKSDPGISCSRFNTTSPAELINHASGSVDDFDFDEWGVCVLAVHEVRKLGFTVVHKPEGVDIGHCEIQGNIGRGKSLSKIARMLTKEEIETGTLSG